MNASRRGFLTGLAAFVAAGTNTGPRVTAVPVFTPLAHIPPSPYIFTGASGLEVGETFYVHGLQNTPFGGTAQFVVKAFSNTHLFAEPLLDADDEKLLDENCPLACAYGGKLGTYTTMEDWANHCCSVLACPHRTGTHRTGIPPLPVKQGEA